MSGFCSWKLDEIDCAWDTGCGNAFQFIDGGPRDNKFRHCPYCGGVLDDGFFELGGKERPAYADALAAGLGGMAPGYILCYLEGRADWLVSSDLKVNAVATALLWLHDHGFDIWRRVGEAKEACHDTAQ